jgi:hypothetical protein
MSKPQKNCFFPFHQQHFSTFFLPNFSLVLKKCPKTKLQRSESQTKGKKSHPGEKKKQKTPHSPNKNPTTQINKQNNQQQQLMGEVAQKTKAHANTLQYKIRSNSNLQTKSFCADYKLRSNLRKQIYAKFLANGLQMYLPYKIYTSIS